MKKILDSDWLKGVQTKISEVSMKTTDNHLTYFEGGRNSPKTFQREQITSFENRPNPSIDQQISLKYF